MDGDYKGLRQLELSESENLPFDWERTGSGGDNIRGFIEEEQDNHNCNAAAIKSEQSASRIRRQISKMNEIIQDEDFARNQHGQMAIQDLNRLRDEVHSPYIHTMDVFLAARMKTNKSLSKEIIEIMYQLDLSDMKSLLYHILEPRQHPEHFQIKTIDQFPSYLQSFVEIVAGKLCNER
ncbi:unnamed protein product, partial [Mesorhabditis belari]|uniref:Uncharacterized protein n=1 Tax=Mesorhabditis belari TaxID=2138241 RepID=A0AAF3EU06_9BILA